MAETPEAPKHSFLTASDGTSISYYTVGQGPGLIVLHGAASFALTHLDLANALSLNYTVYLPSKRGRGLSGPYPESVTKLNPLYAAQGSSSDSKVTKSRTPSASSSTSSTGSRRKRVYNPEFASLVLQTDISDLSDLIQHTGASYIVGVSGGALLTIQACVLASSPSPPFPALTTIRKVILFEPPLFFNTSPTNGPLSVDLFNLSRFEAEITAGRISDALVTAMKIVQLGPLWLRVMPRFIIRMLTEFGTRAEAGQAAAKREAGEEDQGVMTMADLAPMLRYDFATCEYMVGDKERFGNVFTDGGREALLLGGSESPGYARETLRVMEEVMEGRGVRRVEINNVGHEALLNRDRRGKLEEPLEIIRNFLS
jgi:pimeloyl-ACP methyl ester carboxylesterase